MILPAVHSIAFGEWLYLSPDTDTNRVCVMLNTDGTHRETILFIGKGPRTGSTRLF